MTHDQDLSARLAELQKTSQDHSPFSNLFERALCDAYRSGHLITLADYEAAVAKAVDA